MSSSVAEGVAGQRDAVGALSARSPRLPGVRGQAIAASGLRVLVLLSTIDLIAAAAHRPFLPTVVLSAAVWFVALTAVSQSSWLSPHALGIPSSTAIATALGTAGVSALSFWVPAMMLDPLVLLLLAGAVFAASMASARVTAALTPTRRRLLFVGWSPHGSALTEELREAQAPFDCIGVVSAPGDQAAVPERLALGTIADLDRLLPATRPDIVVLVTDRASADALPKLLDNAAADFRVVGLSHFYEHALGRVPVAGLSAAWFLSVLHLNQRAYPRLAKRTLDLVLAGAGLIVFAPLLPVIVALVRMSGPGGVLYRQVRLGEGGRTFEILKFRTMHDGAEAEGRAQWAAIKDPRVTPIGRILRRMRLDELPQLLNVARGDMSVVGPRPERPEFVDLLEAEVPFWSRRHLIKPGITGWAQVRCGYTSDVVGTAEKLSYDLFYIKHRSLALDLAITVMTARTILSGAGAQ